MSQTVDPTGETYDLLLGEDIYLKYFQWAPQRDINPQFEGIPDIPRHGALLTHRADTETGWCAGSITFDNPGAQALNAHLQAKGFRAKPLWQVESFDPLTISPSVLCDCGWHGFIRGGKWEPC